MSYSKLTGTTGGYIHEKTSFFQPFTSASDLFGRGTSVATAPAMYAGLGIISLGAALKELITGFINLITGEFSDSWKNVKDSGKHSLNTLAYAILAVVSPIANLIDIIGATIVSILPNKKDEAPDDYPSYQYN